MHILFKISTHLKKKNYKNMIFPLILTFLTVPIYIYKLDKIPTNITGDENTFLISVYNILFSHRLVSPTELMGDGTQPAFNFYLMIIPIFIVGLENALLGMRLTTVIFSIGTILIFYILLKKYTSPITSFFITFLMATSVWYINFSRAGWFNLEAVLFGLIMIYFLEKGLKEKKLKSFGIAGFWGGICFYSYFISKVYPLAAFIYLTLDLTLNRKLLKQKVKFYLFFNLALFITVLPLLLTIFSYPEKYSTRPLAVFIFNNQSVDVLKVLSQQIIDVLKGLFLIDGSVIGKGIENLRYFPPKTPVVDLPIKILFLAGIFISLKIKVRIGIWWLVYFLTLIVAIVTIDAPNLNRSISALPFIYFISGITLHEIIKKLRKKINIKTIVIILIIISLFISTYNINYYFSWITSPTVAEARQPAIDYNEFHDWQNFQIQRIKNNQPHITNQEWYLIREQLKIK